VRRFLLPLLILLLGAGALAPAAVPPKKKQKIVVITNVNIVDVDTGSLLPRVAVVIKKGKITAIAKRALIQESPEIAIVNGEGKYLIPGLWDMSLRLLPGGDGERSRNVTLPRLLAQGVTGVRDPSGELPALKALRKEVERGEVAGPRIVAAAPAPGDPVLIVHDLEEARTALRRQAGASLLLGTGAPAEADPGVLLHRELALLVEAGLTPLQALQAATLNPVRFLGKEKDMGRVEGGNLADLVLLDANPLDDIGNLDKVDGVVAAGRFYSRRDLDEMLAQAEAAAAGKDKE
jgi:imidazolonepropionase-like amidohydrolase